MADDFVRRGPGRPRKDAFVPETTHVIHSDGTYSNPANMVSAAPPPPVKKDRRAEVRHNLVLIFDVDGKEVREIVRDYDARGIYTKPVAMQRNPTKRECNFWRWDEYDRHIRDIIEQQ